MAGKIPLQPQFSRFLKCYEHMRMLSEYRAYDFGHGTDRQKKSMMGMAKALALGIEKAQRFYVPMNAGIIDGKELTAEIKELARLPFDCIAILTEQKYDDRYRDRITIAFNQKFNLANRLLSYAPARDGFFVSCAIKSDEMWIPGLNVAFCALIPDKSGVEIEGFSNPGFPVIDNPEDDRHPAKEMRDDITDVLNLCVMLGLHNVKSIEELPPERLSRKRLACNKTPLFSYHVLSVDGEKWADISAVHKDGSGVRSHMRRGHIRRLHIDGRKIWVRATMVHGARPGFVEKEYAV